MDPIRDPEGNEITHLHQLGQLDGMRILEIGCGTGRMTWRYASRPVAVVGLDPSPEKLATALANRPADLAKKVDFIQGTAEMLPFGDEFFDVAIMAWSL